MHMHKWKRMVSLFLLGTGIIGSLSNRIDIQAQTSNVDWKEYETDTALLQLRPYAEWTLSEAELDYEKVMDNWYAISLKTDSVHEKLESMYGSHALVRMQPDYVYEGFDFSEEYALSDPLCEKQWGLDMVEAPEAWNLVQSEEPVVVAVIDTGVDIKHEDLKGNIWINEGEIPGNGKDDDGNGYVDDVHGWDFYNGDKSVCSYSNEGRANPSDNDNHGTHCAGTIAAVANNGVGIRGVASNLNIKIMVIKALGGANGATSSRKLIQAIQYATSNGADIINASWGGWVNEDDTALKKAIARSGLLFVAAAGNEGKDNDKEPCFPASYNRILPNVISVGSVGQDNCLSDFSNYGNSVDILAPGASVYSTVVGGYKRMSGTSMAAPYVTGIAAMLYAGREHLYAENVRQILLNAYRPLETIDAEQVAYPGVISARNAVEHAGMLLYDEQEPGFVELYYEYDGSIHIKGVDEGNSGVCVILYAKGKKAEKYFRNGTRGTVVTSNQLSVAESGMYTFYIRDYAGNSEISRIYVTVDRTAPSVRLIKKGKKFKLLVKDADTKVTSVRYSFSKQRQSYFASGNGKELSLKRNGTHIWKGRKGYVSICATDLAGNVTCKVFRLG